MPARRESALKRPAAKSTGNLLKRPAASLKRPGAHPQRTVLKRPTAGASASSGAPVASASVRDTPVVVNLLSGEEFEFENLSKDACAKHLRARLEEVQPSPPGSFYQLLLGDLQLLDHSPLPDAPSLQITAAVRQGIEGSWTRSLMGKDIPINLPTYMAYSPSLDYLILGTTNNHSDNLLAVDVTTLSVRDVKGLDRFETPFPGGGMAIGALGSSKGETIFLSENRYDHLCVAQVRTAESASVHCLQGSRFGEEGSEYMMAPELLALDPSADELWIVRGEGSDQAARFICIVNASTGKKLGVILHTSLSDDGTLWPDVGGLALSDSEVFVAIGQTVKVFARGERVDVQVPTIYVGQEVGRGYAFRRQLKLEERPNHLLCLHKTLVACCPSAVYILDHDGTELRHIQAAGTEFFSARCAAMCERSAELAVMDCLGNVHFFT